MKILISYPPYNNQKESFTLDINQKLKFFYEANYDCHLVLATAATLIANTGKNVIWNDSPAAGLSHQQFIDFIQAERPDLIVFEPKISDVKQCWKIINEIKEKFISGKIPKIALCGSHVTALPEESFQNSQVDFVLTGGDFDFLLLNLCLYLSSAENIEFKAESPRLEPGIYYLEDNQIKNTGQFNLNHDLNTLPFIDRDLTKWKLYPSTHVLSARDLPLLYPRPRTRNANNVLNEIGTLIYRYKVREIIDDSEVFPSEDWLREFCRGMISTGYNKKVLLGCHMNFGSLAERDYHIMRNAGFRSIFFKLEPTKQNALGKVGNDLKAQEVIDGCRLAAQAGLHSFLTIMFGYPWQSYEDTQSTLKLGRWLLKKGYVYKIQGAMIIPYPGTALFDECKQNVCLRSFDWNDYDATQPIMQTSIPDNKFAELMQDISKPFFNPKFIFRKLFSLYNVDSLKSKLRFTKKNQGSKCIGH